MNMQTGWRPRCFLHFFSYIKKIYLSFPGNRYVKEPLYYSETAGNTLRIGKRSSLLVTFAFPLFILQDIYVLKMSILHWRLIGYIPFILFCLASFTMLPGRIRLVIPSYAAALFSFMVMMSGIVFHVYSDQGSSIYQRYLVIDSLVVSTLVVFLFSGGAKRYLLYILFLPFLVLAVALVSLGRIPKENLTILSNPAAVSLCVIAMSIFQERLSYKEFHMRMIAANRGKIIEEKSSELECVNKELSSTLYQLERDLEAQHKAEERIRQDQHLLQAFLDAITEPAYIVDKKSDIVFANQAFATRVNRSLSSVVGVPISALLPELFNKYKQVITDTVLGQKKSIRIELEEGDSIIEYTIYPVLDSKDEIIYFGVLGKDITDRKTNERELEYFAIHDTLTALFNRRFLLEKLKKTIAYSKHGHPGALLYIDLDNFKIINDKIGHDAGDAVLKRIADLFIASFRDNDTSFRIGGDEFAVLLNDTTFETAIHIAERLRAAIDLETFTFNDEVFMISLSIGVYAIDGSKDSDYVLAQADAAMYKAKRSGKNKVVSVCEEPL